MTSEDSQKLPELWSGGAVVSAFTPTSTGLQIFIYSILHYLCGFLNLHKSRVVGSVIGDAEQLKVIK